MKLDFKKARTRAKGICIVKGCKRVAIGKFCNSCRVKDWRFKHPVEYAYSNLKNRAKQRGIPFEISLQDFKSFCHKTQYIAGKGRTANSLSVDRIDQSKGYVKGNLQALTLSENVKKYVSYCYITKTAKAVTTERNQDNENFF
jgi:cobalamin biosynthesis protein CobT